MITPVEKRSAAERAELRAFARRLNGLLAQKGMSPSDLARAIWGSTTDNRGRNVARNRDRISHYVNGKQMPEPKTIKLLADVFGVSPAELAPSLGMNVAAMTAIDREAPAEMSMILVAGTVPTMAMVTLHKLLPLGVASQILALVAETEHVSISIGTSMGLGVSVSEGADTA